MTTYSTTALCQCGCGLPAPIARQTERRRGYVKGEPRPFRVGHNHRPGRKVGYAMVYRPTHPRAHHGCIYTHVDIVERALGRILPDGVEIHHVDLNHQNNENTNLVVCQDKAYHKLLHYRTKIVKAGGDPNTDKACCDCQQVKALSDFNLMRHNKSTGRQSMCRECSKVRDAAKRARKAA